MLELVFTVVDCDGVVVAVETMDQSLGTRTDKKSRGFNNGDGEILSSLSSQHYLDGGFVEVANVGSCLTRFLTQHH